MRRASLKQKVKLPGEPVERFGLFAEQGETIVAIAELDPCLSFLQRP